jgi:hypothetical protein
LLSSGQLNQQQFVQGVQRCMSPSELDDLLHFSMIPSSLLDDANMLPSLQSSTMNLRHGHTVDADESLSDTQLRHISQQAAKKNWSKLALSLGFLEYDIEAYRVRNKNDSSATVSSMSISFTIQFGNELKFNNELFTLILLDV